MIINNSPLKLAGTWWAELNMSFTTDSDEEIDRSIRQQVEEVVARYVDHV